MRRVVITGLGAATPYGLGHEPYWQALLARESGIHEIPRFVENPIQPIDIAGVVPDFDVTAFMPEREVPQTDRYIHLAVAAAKLALRDADLEVTDENRDRFGASVGNVIGGVDFIVNNQATLLQRGPRRVSPFLIPGCIPSMAAGQVSMQLGLRGPNLNSGAACAAGNQSIGEAFRQIKYGYADRMIAGGSESPLTPIAVSGFTSLRATARGYATPETASRPFDAQRTGFVIAEGAGLLVLEAYELAKARGARIYAEIAGYGLSSDAYHITAPDPDGSGPARCIAAALDEAALNPEDVDAVNAHGTSTPVNDKMETKALHRAFGEHAKALWVSSTKSYIGHAMGAAGGVEAVASALCIYHGVMHPTLNYEHPDPECDLDYVPGDPREKPLRALINNSFGFGGTNATLVLVPVEGK